MKQPIILAALCLSACAPEAPAPQPAAHPSTYVEVLDGRTLRIKDHLYRIDGISTPALAPAAGCWAEAALALQAAERLQALVDRAKAAPVVQTCGRDSDGATLAAIELGGYDAADHLVTFGVAAPAERGWDWCDSTDFQSQGGPSLEHGPDANRAYRSWLTARSNANDPDLAAYGKESGPAR